jgi:N-acetyl-gamma-glutamyl-phosphate reductase
LIKVGIVGVSGYSGIELFHILLNHPNAEITAVSSQTHNGQEIGRIYPHLSNIKITCKDYSAVELADLCDVVFTAVPHGETSMNYAKPLKKAGKKFIDLSADFRIKDKGIYEKWYKVSHTANELLAESVYGLPELHKNDIKKAWLIANPGCYTTAAILSVAPLLKEDLIDGMSIIIDSKSGTSGAGRKLKQNLHFSELDEGFRAYSIAGSHRHIPEIEQELNLLSKKPVKITFTPHLLPIVRGILNVSYANLTVPATHKQLINLYKEFYAEEPFVRILEHELPDTKFVRGTNYIDISVNIDERTNRVIAVSSIDNLVKGASGQAVQNMNLAFGLDEKTGLNLKPLYP